MGIKSLVYTIKEKLSQEAKNVIEKLDNQEKLIKCQKIYLKGGNNVEYDFDDYGSFKELFKAIHYINVTIEKAERIQEGFNAVIDVLKNYKPKKSEYI